MAEEDLILRLKVEGGRIVADEMKGADDAVGKYERTASKAHATTSKLGGSFSNLRSMAAMALGASGIGGLALGMGEVVKNAEGLQAAQAQAGAAIKAAHDHTRNATGAMTDFADAQALRGGFTTPEELQSMTAFERITHNVAKSEQEMTLATNLARGAHLSMSRATRVVIMAEAGHVSMLARLGIILPKHATALQAVTALTQRYSGATAAYSHTAQGSMSNLSNLVEILTAKLGAMLLPALTAVFHWLGQFITQIESGTGAGGVFRDIVLALWQGVSALFGALKDTVGALVTVVQGALKGKAGFQALAVFVAALVVGFTAWRVAILAQKGAMEAATAVQWLWNAAMDANPIGLVVIAIAALVAGLVVAYNHVKFFRDIVNGVWTWLKGAVVDTIHFVSDHWGQIGGVLAAPFKAVGSFIGSAFTGVKGVVVDILNFIIGRVNDVIGILDSLHISTPFGDIGVPHINKIGLIGTGGPAHAAAYHQAAGTLTGRGAGHRAYGGPVNYGGVYDVGEHGRERVHLPAGSYVDAHPDSSRSELVAAFLEALSQVSINLDGRQVGRGLLRSGSMQAALQ